MKTFSRSTWIRIDFSSVLFIFPVCRKATELAQATALWETVCLSLFRWLCCFASRCWCCRSVRSVVAMQQVKQAQHCRKRRQPKSIIPSHAVRWVLNTIAPFAITIKLKLGWCINANRRVTMQPDLHACRRHIFQIFVFCLCFVVVVSFISKQVFATFIRYEPSKHSSFTN